MQKNYAMPYDNGNGTKNDNAVLWRVNNFLS
jgi:hypothetical protein